MDSLCKGHKLINWAKTFKVIFVNGDLVYLEEEARPLEPLLVYSKQTLSKLLKKKFLRIEK